MYMEVGNNVYEFVKFDKNNKTATNGCYFTTGGIFGNIVTGFTIKRNDITTNYTIKDSQTKFKSKLQITFGSNNKVNIYSDYEDNSIEYDNNNNELTVLGGGKKRSSKKTKKTQKKVRTNKRKTSKKSKLSKRK